MLYSIGELVPRLISFMLLPIFTNYLSPKDYGIVSYVNSILLFVTVLSALSLNTFFLRHYHEFKDDEAKGSAVWTISSFILMFNALITVFFFLVGPWVIRVTHVQVDFYPFFALALVFNWLEVISIVPMALYRIQERAFAFVTVNIIKTLVQFIAIYTMIVYFKQGVLGNFYGRIIVSGVFFFIFLTVIIKNSSFTYNSKLLSAGLKFSLPLLPGAFSYLLLGMADRLIMERFMPLSAIGIFSIAYTIAFSITVAIQGGYRAFEPVIFRVHGTDNAISSVKQVNNYFMSAVLILGLCICLFSREVIYFMANERYRMAYLYIPGLVIGFCFNAQNLMYNTILTAERRTSLVAKATMYGAIICVIANIALIPYMGIWGAVVGNMISFLVMNVFCERYVGSQYVFRKELYISVFLIALMSMVLYFSTMNLIVLFFVKVLLTLAGSAMILKIYNVRILSLIKKKGIGGVDR